MPTQLQGTTPVTVDNFIRAETDRTFASFVTQGGLGQFEHFRELAPVDDQHVQRGNRDTLYSMGVFDLDAGPVTISLPEAGKRFMTMIVIDEDHYVFTVVYGAGRHTIAKDKVGTRYALAGIRILVDPNDAKDVAQVHALQDAIKIEQPGGPGRFEIPQLGPGLPQESQRRAECAGRDPSRLAARCRPQERGRSDPAPDRHRHRLGPQSRRGRDLLEHHAKQERRRNDPQAHRERRACRGFWSISLYNAEGYFVKNDRNAYTLNNVTAKKDADGSVTVQFGGCDGKATNCLPIMRGWNYMVRLYRPRAEVLNGRWNFPQAQPSQ